jgi:hypothetical protein
MNLLVVGAGEMGRWFARTVAAGSATAPSVAFTDTDPSAARETADAFERGPARAVPTDTDETFDAVAFAVPIPALESMPKFEFHIGPDVTEAGDESRRSILPSPYVVAETGASDYCDFSFQFDANITVEPVIPGGVFETDHIR